MTNEEDAANRVKTLLAKPLAAEQSLRSIHDFDPWEMLPVYGSYGQDFDQCALDVLQELMDGRTVRDDLGAEMFREILCVADLCDYGTSPRTCWPTPGFALLLPELRVKWAAWSAIMWKE